MKMKVGVIGAGGRVGQELLSLIKENPSYIPQVGVFGKKLGSGFVVNTQELKKETLLEADVWIDFSTPEVSEILFSLCAQAKKPLVSGTTGFNEQQKMMLERAASQVPLLWSSNMSLGIAVLREILPILKGLAGFDFQIEEFHHNKKKDSPSGTAITLQEDLERELGKRLPHIMAARGGGIFGIHRVFSMSDEETLTFEHVALNRRVFAKGALAASEWLLRQSPGLYSMKDVLSRK